MLYLIQIGFFKITFWDILDILIVGYMMAQVYKLLKGSLGFNIFLGIVFVYAIWWLVTGLGMPLLSTILGQFISVGMIALLVLFQPELRRFLLLLGQSSVQSRFKFLAKYFYPRQAELDSHNPEKERLIREVLRALDHLADTKTGALVLFLYQSGIEGLYSSGIPMHAQISAQLLISVFNKESPLHDGAVIIGSQKILLASCVLPVSESPNIPQKLGLRHRAAVGITEVSDVIAVVVSEETGKISYIRGGQITQDIQTEWLHKVLTKVF